MRDHPGGPDALMEVAGTDATSAYEDVSRQYFRTRTPTDSKFLRWGTAKMQERSCTLS